MLAETNIMAPSFQIHRDTSLMGSQILCSPLTFLKLAARVNQENVDLLIDPDLDDETLRLSPRLYDVFEGQLKGIMSLELD